MTKREQKAKSKKKKKRSIIKRGEENGQLQLQLQAARYTDPGLYVQLWLMWDEKVLLPTVCIV